MRVFSIFIGIFVAAFVVVGAAVWAFGSFVALDTMWWADPENDNARFMAGVVTTLLAGIVTATVADMNWED